MVVRLMSLCTLGLRKPLVTISAIIWFFSSMGHIMSTVDICRYENLESLGKCFVPFFHTHLPSAFQGITFKCAR